MTIRSSLAVAIGVIQSVIALSAMTVAGALYFNLFNLQTLLNEVTRYDGLHSLILFFFGFISFLSGLFLVDEWLESTE